MLASSRWCLSTKWIRCDVPPRSATLLPSGVTDSYGQFTDASFVATISPPPAPPIPPTPDEDSAGTQAPAPTPTVCASRRLLNVHFRVPGRTKVRSLRVTIDGKARRLTARSRQVTVDLRGMGPRTVRVVIAATVVGGKRMSAVRVFRTCATRSTCRPRRSFSAARRTSERAN